MKRSWTWSNEFWSHIIMKYGLWPWKLTTIRPSYVLLTNRSHVSEQYNSAMVSSSHKFIGKNFNKMPSWVDFSYILSGNVNGRLYQALKTLSIKQFNIVHYNDIKILYNAKNSISITILEQKEKNLLLSPMTAPKRLALWGPNLKNTCL